MIPMGNQFAEILGWQWISRDRWSRKCLIFDVKVVGYYTYCSSTMDSGDDMVPLKDSEAKHLKTSFGWLGFEGFFNLWWPWEPRTISFRIYDPYFLGLTLSFFHGSSRNPPCKTRKPAKRSKRRPPPHRMRPRPMLQGSQGKPRGMESNLEVHIAIPSMGMVYLPTI